MKELVFLLVGFLLGRSAYGQTFAEWFQQKKTQIKYLQQQIVALQAYKGVLEKGYEVVKRGTALVAVVKQGDLDMHKDHFNSRLYVNLDNVNSFPFKAALDFSGYTKRIAGEIRTMTAQRKSLMDDWSVVGARYAESVIADCDTEEGEIMELMTSNRLSMTDDERSAAVYAIVESMQDRYKRAVQHKIDFDTLLKDAGL